MVFRYLGYGLLTLVFHGISLFITPINYFFKDWVREKEVKPWLWFWSSNAPFDKNDKDWGDYGRFKHTYLGFIQQNAGRNSHGILRDMFRPKYEKPYDLVGDVLEGDIEELGRTWNVKLGSRYGTFKMYGVKYFRWTWNKKILWWYSHGQFGLSRGHLNSDGTVKKAGRYYYKLKSGWFNNIKDSIANNKE